MLLKVFHSRVELQDNVGNTMAVLAFPEVSDGVCEMHDIFLNVDSIKDNARNKMITYALVQIRKNNWQVIPAGPESSAWFDQHPSDRDLLRSAANPQVQQPQPQPQPEPVVEKQVQPQPQPNPSVVNSGGQAVVQETQKVASGAIRVLSRFLQILAAACMVGIIVVFVMNWFTNRNIGYWMFSQIDRIYWIFLIANAAFLILAIVFMFWILSRKGYYAGDQVVKVDTGRGITAFVMILLVYIGCFIVVRLFGYSVPMTEYIQMFMGQLTLIPMLAILGLVLCIIRKVIGK
ncbi:MAG: hypothetical protein J6D18_05060 [Erysipelotrichaceae bacterium]|nr:hypothetical protein [Erysipelotrichaceae bacterium]